MKRHADYNLPGCPVEACAEVIGGKWKGKILFHLMRRTLRFGELRKLMPDTTQRMLTLQLRELEEDGVIIRKVYAEVPPRVEYSISPEGRALELVIQAMWTWGTNYLASKQTEQSDTTNKAVTDEENSDIRYIVP